MKKMYILPLLLASLCLAGCESKEYHEYEDLVVKIESADVIFSATGGASEIVIASDGAFTAASDQPWCVVLPVNNRTVPITVTPNLSVSSRNARITVKSGDKSAYVSVTQNSVSFKLAAADTVLAGKGDTVRIPFDTEAPLHIEADPWLKDSVDVERGEIVLWAALNPSLDSDRTTTVTVSAQNQDGETVATLYAQSFTVSQPHVNFTMNSAATLTGVGSEVRIPFETEAVLDVEPVADDWLTVSVEGQELVLQATPNPGLDSRAATVTVALQSESITFHTQDLDITQSPAKFNMASAEINISKDGGERRVACETETGVTLAVEPVTVDWLTASVEGQELVLQATANLGLGIRAATVTVALQYAGVTFRTQDIAVEQQAFTFEPGTYSNISYAASSELRIPFDADVDVEIDPSGMADWLTASVNGQEIIVTATTANPTGLKTRTATVKVALKKDGSTTLTTRELPVTQDKNAVLSYTDFLGSYTMGYSMAAASSVTRRAIPVTLSEKVQGQSYVLDGILPDNENFPGTITVNYNAGTITILNQIAYTYPAGTNFTTTTVTTSSGTVTVGGSYTFRIGAYSLTSTGGAGVGYNVGYGVTSSDIDLSDGGLTFNMVNYGNWANNTVVGFMLRIYNNSGTGVAYVYGKKPISATNSAYYTYLVFEKQREP